MSLKTNKLTLFAGFLVAGFMLFQSCEKKLAELSEGTLVELNSDLLHTPIIVRFEDAVDGSVPSNINVEFVGKDADKLYSTSGKSTLKPTEGLMDIGFEKSINVSEDAPFEFSIITKAPGYLSTQHSVVLMDAEAQELVIRMVNLDNPPMGVTITNHIFSANATGTTEELVLETIADTPDAPTLSIPQGTKLYDENGNELTGQVNLQIVNFDPSVEGATEFAAQSNMAILPDGDTAYGVFADLSLLDFTMMVGNVEATFFSNPLILETQLPAGAADENEALITEGYAIPSWSMEESTGAWLKEADNIVENIGGELVIRTPITHFSLWSVRAFFQTFFTNSNSFLTISSDVPNSSQLNYKYHSEMTFRFFGRTYQSYAWSQKTHYFRDGEQIAKPAYLWSNLPYRLQVYDAPRGCNRSVIAESQSFRFSDNPTVNISSLFALQPVVTINFVADVLCTGVTVKPTMYVLYKENSNDCFRLLGVMVNGQLQTSQLNLDTAYDFKSVWNDEAQVLSNIVIRDEAIRFGAEMNPPLSAAEVNEILNNIDSETGLFLVNNANAEFIDNWVIQGYSIMPTQAQCDNLTGG